MNASETHPPTLKEKVRHEMIEYAFNVLYLTLVFAAFTVYQRLVLAAYDIVYTNYWFALIEALILGKVIMIGGLFHLGSGLEDKALIYPTFFKTFVFTLFVAVFKLIEYVIKGLVAGIGVAGGIAQFTDKGLEIILANSLVVFVALAPFFALKELSRVIGREKISALFFGPRSTK